MFIVAFSVGAAVGFAAGRIKNVNKLEAIRAEITKLEGTAAGIATESALAALVSKLKTIL